MLALLRYRPTTRTMPSSRRSQEASKYFSNSAASTPSSLPRRSTRSSLARFAYTTTPSVKDEEDDSSLSSLSLASDIEDAIIKAPASPRRNGPSTTTTLKRKRTTTQTTTTPSTSKIKLESDELEVDFTTRVRKPARTITSPLTGTTTVHPPSNWEEIYSLVKQMRLPGGRASNAAVDTMGCERLVGKDATPKDKRFHTLVALMLSSQTKDTVTAEAMGRLMREMPAAKEGGEPGLNLENMIAIESDKLNEIIGKVGFHNNKTKYLKQTALLLRDKFGGDIPPTIEGLISLPGVGPKMAHLCMSATDGWNRVEGIGVDVHVHRITNLWGWQNPPSKNPEETRMALQAWLPRDRWKEINWLLVGFGQTVCLPVGRRCGECEVGLAGLCKSAERKKVNEGIRRRREVKVEVKRDGEGYKKVEKVGKEEERTVVKEEVVDEELPEGVKLEDVKEVGGGDVKDEVKQEVKQEVEQEEEDYSMGGTRSWRKQRAR
ncbi:DNA repair protein Ntg1, partial [Coniochaeta sp. 2T2.1]